MYSLLSFEVSTYLEASKEQAEIIIKLGLPKLL